jgi:hypothetical protein
MASHHVHGLDLGLDAPFNFVPATNLNSRLLVKVALYYGERNRHDTDAYGHCTHSMD